MFQYIFYGKAKDLQRDLKLAIALEGRFGNKFLPLPPVHSEDFKDNNYQPETVTGPDPRD